MALVTLPVCLINDQKLILKINNAFADWTQTSNQDKLIGRKIQNILDSINSCHHTLHNHQKFYYSAPDRSSAGYETIVIDLSLPNQKEDYSLVLIHEATHIETEQVRSSKQEQMGETNIVAGSIIHELNNPLNGLMTFLSLIKRDLPTNQIWRDDFARLETEAQKCNEAVKSLADYI